MFWKDQQEIRLDLWPQVWVRALKRREWPGPEVRSACSSHPSTLSMCLNCSLRKSRFGVPGLSWESPSGLIVHYISKAIADETLRKLHLLDYYPWATKGACKGFRLLWPKLVSIWFTVVKQLPFWAFMSFNINRKKHSYIFEQLLWDTHEMKSVQSFCQLWHALWRCREINTATSASYNNLLASSSPWDQKDQVEVQPGPDQGPVMGRLRAPACSVLLSALLFLHTCPLRRLTSV